MIAEALRLHDGYYRMLGTMLRGLEAQFGRFVVLDMHSYNHRRDGPDAPPADARRPCRRSTSAPSRWTAAGGATSLDPLMERAGGDRRPRPPA